MIFDSKNSQISEVELNKNFELLREYVNDLQKIASENSYEKPESSICLPSDQSILEEAKKLKNSMVDNTLKYIIVIGIGGSNLGTKAVYDGLGSGHLPKMIFLDTQTSASLRRVEELIKSLDSKNEVVVNALSKSGGTTETMANLEVVLQLLVDRFGENCYDRVVCTTDEGSPLYSRSIELGIRVLTIPAQVGGRYSVFSTVGVFPLLCVGVDAPLLLEGAVKMRNDCLSFEISTNPAARSALTLFLLYKKGWKIHDLFIFIPELESLGKWYRQLMGESLGKEGLGITPTVSIGSTDLHSVGQLYLGGPKDKNTMFISLSKTDGGVLVPKSQRLGLIPSIAGQPVEEIMNAIVSGTKKAYLNQDLPYTEVFFAGTTTLEIGEFMQWKMIEMMFLGRLMGVSAFDQPHVELYKTETKKILAR